MAKQNEVIAKLQSQNRKLHKKLRQADSKIDSKLDSKVDTAMRQKDQNINTELKKLIKSEITNFLINDVVDGRSKRDLGGQSFAVVQSIFPAQVDLNKWTAKFERKFANFTETVAKHFERVEAHIDRFESMEIRLNETNSQMKERLK